jgi:hypothetical protein
MCQVQVSLLFPMLLSQEQNRAHQPPTWPVLPQWSLIPRPRTYVALSPLTLTSQRRVAWRIALGLARDGLHLSVQAFQKEG